MMNSFNDDKKLLTILIVVASFIVFFLTINYLWNGISQEGQKLKNIRLVEARVIPLLKTNDYGFIQKDNVIYGKSYLFASFDYPHHSQIKDKLKALDNYLHEYSLRSSYFLDTKRHRYIFRIKQDKDLIAVFHFYQKEKKYKGKIAIIIDDFGYNNGKTTQGFENLPYPINISIIPGHKYSRSIARELKNSIHEIMIHMPMEPMEYYGGEEEYILMSGMSNSEVNEKVLKAVDDIPGAKAMNNHMGSKATSDPDLMQKLARSLSNKHLMFIDSYTYSGSVASEMMSNYQIPVFKRDIFIDNEKDIDYIESQLLHAAKIAEKYGSVIAIGHNRTTTLKALRKVIPELLRRDLKIIKVSDL